MALYSGNSEGPYLNRARLGRKGGDLPIFAGPLLRERPAFLFCFFPFFFRRLVYTPSSSSPAPASCPPRYPIPGVLHDFGTFLARLGAYWTLIRTIDWGRAGVVLGVSV